MQLIPTIHAAICAIVRAVVVVGVTGAPDALRVVRAVVGGGDRAETV